MVGFPIAALGLVVVLIQGTTVAASWVAHRIGRRFELRKIVTVNAVFLVGATIVIGALPSIPSIALMLVVALVPSLVGPLLTTRINDIIPTGQRATILSLARSSDRRAGHRRARAFVAGTRRRCQSFYGNRSVCVAFRTRCTSAA